MLSEFSDFLSTFRPQLRIVKWRRNYERGARSAHLLDCGSPQRISLVCSLAKKSEFAGQSALAFRTIFAGTSP